MKIAIVTDTNSGITPEEGKEQGIFVLPMPLIVDDREYLDCVNLSQEDFYRFLAEGADVTTSQPAAGDVIALWDRIFAEGYDEIVHYDYSFDEIAGPQD